MSVRSVRARPRLEPLDDRCLPSTFTVTHPLDSGPGSLRDAVAAANAGPGADAINFATTGTIILTGGQLDITDALTISGPGAGALTVSGNDTSRVFRLVGSPVVTVADLTVADGLTVGDPGGGISMAGGTLTLTRVTVSGNTAVGVHGEGGPGLGGGLNVAGGTLTLDQCTVSGNVAVGGSGAGGPFFLYGYEGGSGAGGGAYLAGGTVHVNRSTFSGNDAVGGSGGDSDQQYWAGWENTYGGNGGTAAGGGIHVAGGTLNVRQSTIVGNTAGGGFGGTGTYNGWPGGAAGGGMFFVSATPPRADLDTFTVDHTVNNAPDDITGPYSLNGQPPPPDLAVGDASVVEGHAGTAALVFPVTLSASSGQPVTVGWATADGSATAGRDYSAASGTLTIPAGQTTGVISVPVIGDRLGEPNESLVVTLHSAANAVLLDGQGVGTIQDDEPRVSVHGVTRPEGNSGTSPFDLTVTLSGVYDQPVALTYATADGTATAGYDYQARTGTLTFAPGETTKTVGVPVIGDRLGEYQFDTFFVDLGGASNAVLLSSRGGFTILDDEPRISVGDVSRAEGKKNQRTQFTFTVTLSAAYDQPVTMSFRTANGTATSSDNDYLARTGTLTFAPGETTKTITIEVTGDSKREADETFYLDLFGNGGNSLLVDGRGVGTIVNDD